MRFLLAHLYGSGLNYNTDECSASVRADVQALRMMLNDKFFNVSSMKLSSGFQCVSNSPSKIEGVSRSDGGV